MTTLIVESPNVRAAERNAKRLALGKVSKNVILDRRTRDNGLESCALCENGIEHWREFYHYGESIAGFRCKGIELKTQRIEEKIQAERAEIITLSDLVKQRRATKEQRHRLTQLVELIEPEIAKIRRLHFEREQAETVLALEELEYNGIIAGEVAN